MLIHIPIFDKNTTSIDAITIGPVIFMWIKNPNKRILLHELCHIRQWKRQPFTFHIRYFYEMFRNKLNGMTWREAYLNISYEKEARQRSEALTKEGE